MRVSKNTRLVYNSLIFVAYGVTSIIASQFTKFFLFIVFN